MSQIIWNSFGLTPLLIGSATLSAFAQISVPQSIVSQGAEIHQTEDQHQMTSVSQLSDVRPTDWSFQALQSLVERYGCIAGYPNQTYQGNRALTRFEFAAGLNACLDKFQELMAAATSDFVKKDDLELVKKLRSEFATELAALQGRVGSLETRAATVERQKFSATTKLYGEVIFALSDEFSDRNNNTVLQNRIRLSLKTSFTGKDLHEARLDSGNGGLFEGNQLPGVFKGSNPAGTLGLSEGLQISNIGISGDNRIRLGHLAYYSTALNDRLNYYISTVGGLHYYYAPTLNPGLDSKDSGSTTLSVFGQRNPIYLIGGGAGVGLNLKLGSLTVSLGYLSNTASNPAKENGLFNGNYSGLFQVAYEGDRLGMGATYVAAYKTQGEGIFEGGYRAQADGSVGTTYANIISFFDTTPGLLIGDRAKVDAYGLSGYFKITPKVILNAFATYASADYNAPNVETGEIWTYGLGVSFRDLGKPGNLGGIVVGAQPYLGNPKLRRDFGTLAIPFHLEAFYKYRVNDNISITPGLIWIRHPGQIKMTDDALIGTIRTTFTF